MKSIDCLCRLKLRYSPGNGHNLKKTQNFFILYEETDLLESQIWKKQTIALVQDFLILNYKIKPTIRQLIYQLYILNLYFSSIFTIFIVG